MVVERPWLSLYGNFLKPPFRPKGIESPKLWEVACREAFQQRTPEQLASLVVKHRRSWRHLFLAEPHLRFDGVFVSRNSYLRTGVPDMSRYRIVNVVLYYRYYRFFPDGTLLYCTSPQTIAKVAKSLRVPPKEANPPSWTNPVGSVFRGRYVLKGTQLYIAIAYANSRSTQIRSRLTLRSTVPGANNRLDFVSITSYDTQDGSQSSLMQPLLPDPDAEPEAAQALEHRRGMTCCVFVPWDQCGTSVLNLPSSQMDIFLPG